MLTAAGTTPKRSKFPPLRAAAYRALNQERARAGLPVYTIDQLNQMKVWDMMQETSALINMAKAEKTLFGDGGAA